MSLRTFMVNVLCFIVPLLKLSLMALLKLLTASRTSRADGVGSRNVLQNTSTILSQASSYLNAATVIWLSSTHVHSSLLHPFHNTKYSTFL